MSYSFRNTMKRKVIIAFGVGLLALILAWAVSKIAFKEMLATVQSISTPDEKLKIVNDLFRDITKLDQLQRSQAFQRKPGSYKVFLKESDSLRATMDSLRRLYANDGVQVRRIDKMKSLLRERDRLFMSYIKVREGLVNGRDFANQLSSLSGLIDKSSSEIDSTIVTTEQKFSTTRVAEQDDGRKNRDRSIFNRIFGRKKSDKSPEVVKEEVSITVDTLARANSDSVIHAMEKAVERIAKRQKQRRVSFINREIELSNAGNILINQMLVILQQVEKEVIRQVDLNNSKATAVVNRSARSIELIMLAFILITALLAYLILTDISRSNTYREELEMAKDEAEYHGMAKQRFLSSMSHEIRTPLQSIIGYAEQIKDNDKPAKEDINAIYHSSIHLLHIVNEVLDYSRIVSGRFKFTRSTFSIWRLLDEVMTIMRPQAEKKSLKLMLYNNITDTDLITGDPFRLKQILINLLGNAIKFTEKGEVSLTVNNKNIKRRSYFTFAVKDTGVGIAEEDLSNIFEEFEQADATVANNANGTGLGLSIVKALTEGQGGRVEAESKPGMGSCFTVKLRYAIPKEQAKSPEQNAPSLKSFNGKVWIVDDDQFILQLCSSVFNKNGITHSCFTLPRDVLAQQPPDDLKVVFMDMRMPQMNGAELCKLLREKIPSCVKIYALTAQALPDERSSILSQGFDGLLMKPFRESELLSLLFNQQGVEGKKEEVTNADVDLSAVEKMAYGDKDLIKKIIQRFEDDTLVDLGQLKIAMERDQISEVSLLLHRIAGRTAQIGAKDLAAKFRAEEIMIHNSNTLHNEQKKRIYLYAGELNELKF
ncbi:ATP-binding protein [Arcticibacter tournemirensis]|uniref:histidine kinase n=1 Tax=Arcticibacter tournemirensis TaxID=699437 RepID=A0A4Q0M931_9SPHI|nr:ATP-binding protein [Arcticibacter tournemirensis]RXF69700.1 response regulator [Arcticibacter tournemirensis]